MKISLESYIEKNRDRMDLERPNDEAIWKGIEQRRAKHKSIRLKIIYAAASVLIIILVGTGIYLNQGLHNEFLKEDLILAGISAELAQQNTAYRLSVAEKMNEIKSLELSGTDLNELNSQLNFLDSQYAKYLEDLIIHGDQFKITHGILRCHEKKLRIIEKTLYEIRKSKRHD